MNYKGPAVDVEETTGRLWRFSDYEFDELRRELRTKGKPVDLESKPLEILLQLLAELSVRPYVRRVREPWSTVARLPGARLKRIFLSWMGRRLSRLQEARGFPGNDWLAGSAPTSVIPQK